MIFKPVSAYPSNSVDIDATILNQFYTTIQGSSTVVTAYSATIYKSSDFSQVYTTGKQALSQYLTAGQNLQFNIPHTSGMTNGEAYYWVLRLYQPMPDIFITKTIVQSESTATQIKVRLHNNIKSGMYITLGNEQRQISSYTKDEKTAIGTITVSAAFSVVPTANTEGKIYSDFVDSLQFTFYAKATPTLIMNAIPSVLNTRTQTFLMTYSQAQGVPIKWHRFLLQDNKNATITDTGRVYSSLLELKFDGFADGVSYTIQGFAENIDGVLVETGKKSFSVLYPSPNIELPPQLSWVEEDNAIKVKWVADLFAGGKSTGNYEFINNFPYAGEKSLHIQTGEIIYDNFSNLPLSTTETFSLYSDVTISDTLNGRILTLSNETSEYYIYVDNNSIFQVRNNTRTLLCKVIAVEKSGQQISNIPEDNVSYFWDDTDIWDDAKYWVENKPCEKRFKIIMEPTKIYIERSTLV